MPSVCFLLKAAESLAPSSCHSPLQHGSHSVGLFLKQNREHNTGSSGIDDYNAVRQSRSHPYISTANTTFILILQHSSFYYNCKYGEMERNKAMLIGSRRRRFSYGCGLIAEIQATLTVCQDVCRKKQGSVWNSLRHSIIFSIIT